MRFLEDVRHGFDVSAQSDFVNVEVGLVIARLAYAGLAPMVTLRDAAGEPSGPDGQA